MALNEIFFKVTIASRIDIPLSGDEFTRYPTHEMYIAEYEEKLINVMINPAPGFDVEEFVKFMTKRLMKIYDTPIVEHFEKVKRLE